MDRLAYRVGVPGVARARSEMHDADPHPGRLLAADEDVVPGIAGDLSAAAFTVGCFGTICMTCLLLASG